MDIDRLLSDDPVYATTNANSSEVFSMESIRAAYQKMKDEEWMRPLGLGKLVPTAVFINREIVDDLYRQFNIPEQLLSGDSNYSSAMMDRRFLWNY